VPLLRKDSLRTVNISNHTRAIECMGCIMILILLYIQMCIKKQLATTCTSKKLATSKWSYCSVIIPLYIGVLFHLPESPQVRISTSREDIISYLTIMLDVAISTTYLVHMGQLLEDTMLCSGGTIIKTRRPFTSDVSALDSQYSA
jgi:hypothetical protein